MARMTEASLGVPPKAGRPSKVLITGGAARLIPATSHASGFVTLAVFSTPGLIWQTPQLRSLPNHGTTREAASRLAQSAVRSSIETLQSLRSDETWAFSVVVTPAPALRMMIVVS